MTIDSFRSTDLYATTATTSGSILYPGPVPPLQRQAPHYFGDLNLDQAVDSLLSRRDPYDLAPFFHTRLTDPASVAYRHAVFTDLDTNRGLRPAIAVFAAALNRVRKALATAGKVRSEHEKHGWHLHAALNYVAAVQDLHRYLTEADLASAALAQFRIALGEFVADERFTELCDHAGNVADQLYSLTYCLDIHGTRIRVSRFEGEKNYETDVRACFAKFEETGTPRPTYDFHSRADLNHVEARILDLVARLHPDQFTALAEFRDHHPRFLDELITRFDREIQFYCAVAEFRDRLGRAGLAMCLPDILDTGKELYAADLFDFALADKLATGKHAVVCNDVDLRGPERAIVVTGPNQGGKTTFARAIGQLYHLAALGVPVPAGQARIGLCDKLFTHFEREEDMSTLSGKLEDDLRRVHDILTRATADSVVVMNESFTSTTVRDAALLGAAVLRRMLALDLRCVYVTFIDELSRLNAATVSMVAEVDPADPAVRTFRVTRRTADGLAYAAALAEQHRLTYQQVKERMVS
ncbi:DNA mismatch repair protein MutS [Nocardia nova]|uniref:MutS-related protein n=1 Tax=Nocardia nova TaxID=37330 RepID=UPI0037A90895